MGLDQYAYSISKEDMNLLQTQEFLDGELGIESQEELMYWRKHANLNGHMERLYHQQGHMDSFNGQPLELDKEDLLELKEIIKGEGLEKATGFFWGYSEESDDPPTLEFIEKALQAINEGKVVYYCCSW
jgi:hypothetical protein